MTERVRLDEARTVPGLLWLALGLLTIALVTRLWARNETVRLGYALAEARADRERLIEHERVLTASLSALAAPDRLARRAERELGMRVATPADVTLVPSTPGAAPETSGTTP